MKHNNHLLDSPGQIQLATYIHWLKAFSKEIDHWRRQTKRSGSKRCKTIGRGFIEVGLPLALLSSLLCGATIQTKET